MREPELGDFGLTAEEYLRYIRFEAMKEKVWYKVLVGAGVATWVGCGLTTGNWGLGFMVGIGACLGTAHVQGIFWGCAKRWHPLSGKVRLYEEADDAYGDAYIEAQEEAERAYKETQRRHEEALREAERNRQRTLQRYWMSLSGPQFERELGGLYQKLGYTVQFTPGSGDHGIDLMLKKDGKTTIVQCKRYNEPAGPAVVRELYGTLIHSRADQAILACTGGFTRGVIEFVRGLRVLGAIVALTSSAAAEGLGIHTA